MKKKCMAVGGTAKKPATMEEQLAGIRGKVRPGYQAGGIAGIDYPRSFSGQFPVRQPLGAGLGATAIQSGEYAVNAPGSIPQSLGLLGAPDYSTGPRQGGFVYEDGTPRPSQNGNEETQSAKRGPLSEQIDMGQAMAGLSNTERYKLGGSGTSAEVSEINQRNDILKTLNASLQPTQQIQVGRSPRPGITGGIEEQLIKRGRNGFRDGGIIDKLIRTVGRVLPESNGEKYEPGIQSRAAEDPARHGRAEALNPRTQTAPSETPPSGGFQEEAERRRKQMEEAKNYEAGGLITPVNLGQGLYQAIAQPIAEDWRQGNAAIKKVRDQYPTADSLAGINPFVAAAQVANDVAAGNVGGDTAINVAQAVPVIKGLSGMAKMLTKQAGPTIGATKFVIDMPNTVRKNVALTTGQTLGQPANAFAAGGMVRFSGKGGPRDDQIPVKVAGEEINVSNGENAVILPAKTAANPAALYAIGGIIQATNDGRKPKMGMEKGGKYKDGAYPYDDKPPTAQEVYAGASPAGIVQAITPDSWRTARVVAPAGSVGGGMSSSGTDPRDIPAGGTITNLAPALQQIHNFAKPAYDLSPSMRALGTVGYAVGNVFADSAEAQRQGTTYGAAREARISSEGRANAAPYSNEGRPSALGQAYESYRPPAQGITAGVANADARMQNVAANDGMTTTQMGAGFDPTKLQMAPGYGMATNAAGKTIAVGPSEYVGSNGQPTSRWTDTQQYKDAIARNQADKLRLAEMQSQRLGADPMAVQKASQGIAQSVMQSGLAAQQAGQAQQIHQFAIDRAAREQSLIDAWDKAETPEQKQAIAGQLKIMRGQQDKEGQFKDAVEEVVDEKTGQVIKRPVIYNASTGQPVQQGQAQAQQSFKTADEVEAARKAGKVKSGDVVIINGRPARIN